MACALPDPPLAHPRMTSTNNNIPATVTNDLYPTISTLPPSSISSSAYLPPLFPSVPTRTSKSDALYSLGITFAYYPLIPNPYPSCPYSSTSCTKSSPRISLLSCRQQIPLQRCIPGSPPTMTTYSFYMHLVPFPIKHLSKLFSCLCPLPSFPLLFESSSKKKRLKYD